MLRKKKGSYLLSRIALFDKVYHRCMDSMKDHSKRKRPQRFLSKVFDNKKGSYLLSRIALFDTVYHWTDWGVEGKQKSVHLIAQMNASV